MKYTLEIYPPNYHAGDDALCTIESDIPFLSISVGDILNPATWNEHYQERLKDTLDRDSTSKTFLKIVSIEHLICQSEDETFSTHKLGLYTEVLDASPGE